MLALFIALIVNAIIVFLASYILPGVRLSSLWIAVVVALALGVMNAFIHSVLHAMTIPTNYLTYGIFSFIFSAIILTIISYILPGFKIDGVYWIFIFALIVGLLNGLTHSFLHYSH